MVDTERLIAFDALLFALQRAGLPADAMPDVVKAIHAYRAEIERSERERCAQIAETTIPDYSGWSFAPAIKNMSVRIAAAIRAAATPPAAPGA